MSGSWKTDYNKDARAKADEILYGLDEEVKDAIYHTLWSEKVREDVEAQMEQLSDENSEKVEALSDEEYNDLVGTIADRYAGGDYDCNLDYWSNIDSLIGQEIDKLPDIDHER